MRGKGKDLVFGFSRFFALAVLIVGGAVFITGCQKEKEDIERQPPPTPTPQCANINPPVLTNSTAHTQLGTGEVCVQAGKCVATQVDTENKMAQRYCDRTYTATCSPGACSPGKSCKPKFDLSQSAYLYIRGCSVQSVGPPACAAGEELCKCTLYVAPRGKLDCDCECR